MSQELVTIGGANVPATQPPPGFVDNSGLGDIVRIKPTRLVLVQPMTKDPKGAKIGQILNSNTGEIHDKIELVLLNSHLSRALFPPGGNATEATCRSNDAKVPADDAKVKQAHSCNNCSKAVWVGGKPPACQLKIELLVVDLENELPHYVSVGGKSISPVKDQLGTLFLKMNKSKKNSHAYAFILGAKKDPKSANYMLDVSKIRELTEDEFGKMDSFNQQMLAAKAAAMAQPDHIDEAVGEVIDAEEVVQEV